MVHSFLRRFAHGGLSGSLLAAIAATALAADRVEIAEELERLSQDQGFAVRGLEQAQGAYAWTEGEDLLRRLRALLEDFDHVIVQEGSGKVERVIILGAKVPFEPPPPPADAGTAGGEIQVETQRRGPAHLVRVSLGGAGGVRIERDLQVDTGADLLVLPLSLAAQLGVDAGSLEERELQTANGTVKAGVGTLPSLWLADRRIDGVATAFLEDAKLGSGGLLGMSVLGRYKLTIDDEKNKITLSGKRDGATGDAGTDDAGGFER